MDEATKRLYREYNDPAPKNRTLFLTFEDRRKYTDFPTFAVLDSGKPLDELLDRIYLGDCVKGMALLPPQSVDLVFADPPYNLGKDYGNKKKIDERMAYVRRFARGQGIGGGGNNNGGR